MKVVATMSEDTEHIDTDACSDRNIQVIKINQVPVQTVADLTIGLLILCTQQWLNGRLILDQHKTSKDASTVSFTTLNGCI